MGIPNSLFSSSSSKARTTSTLRYATLSLSERCLIICLMTEVLPALGGPATTMSLIRTRSG